jgi:UDP-GlcNAc:undecaprenyl-phosphate GlcNAc-1-phosphate transferase
MGFDLLHTVSLGVVAFVVTFVLVPVSKRLSKRFDAIDYPSKRRINTYPVPRLGGLALFGGLLVALVVEAVGEFVWGLPGLFNSGNLPTIRYLGVMAGVTLMVGVGAVDDIKKLHPGIKFVGQVAAASVIVLSGVLLEGIGNPFGSEHVAFGWVSYPLTILYLVAFANIINLVDGLDGLAAGIVAIVAIGLLCVALLKGRTEAMILSIILIGVCIAFLRFNRHPASLYMGDSGSLMLGTLLGVVSLIGAMRSPTVIALTAPIIFAGFPVLDTLFAIIRRVRRRQPVHLFDMDHFHHVMLRNGLNPQQVVAIVYVWTAVLTGGGILISNSHGIVVYALFAGLALISALMIWRLGLYTSVLRHHYNPRVRQAEPGGQVEEQEQGRLEQGGQPGPAGPGARQPGPGTGKEGT